MPRNSMPNGWEPPAPAWQSVWRDTADPLVAAYFAIQAEQPTLLDNWAVRAFAGAHPPAALEQAMFVDQRGVSNYLYIGYWRHSEYRKWWAGEGNGEWWANARRPADGVGYWREIVVMPFDRFETLHSTQAPHGIGVTADSLAGPIREHGYPGGARDRIPLSDSDSLKNIDSVATPLPAKVSAAGARVLLAPPENVCVIRSGQNWSYCPDEEKAHYLEKVHPVLLQGMHFLRDNPLETNCYSMRFFDKKNSDWSATEQSFGLGYTTDIYALENWAKSHPTHLAIFGSFMQMVKTFGEQMQLRLWHEVTVLPADKCEFEYIGCHRNTGLLSYIRENSSME